MCSQAPLAYKCEFLLATLFIIDWTLDKWESVDTKIKGHFQAQKLSILLKKTWEKYDFQIDALITMHNWLFNGITRVAS